MTESFTPNPITYILTEQQMHCNKLRSQLNLRPLSKGGHCEDKYRACRKACSQGRRVAVLSGATPDEW